MRTYKIAAIPGDGIGVEVIAAGLKVLDVLGAREGGFKLEIEHFPWSSEYYKKHGYYIPEGGLQRLRTFDAIFFGAVGAPDVPDHLSLWGLR
ncbi:MAG TPA: isocitrate/isopropylmalate family dehydrogenase, partial [Burkholderiales bacterium]|nr:isocitrate/isopropylmalate family dehydrogenase [Burkholderiales bacterium]